MSAYGKNYVFFLLSSRDFTLLNNFIKNPTEMQCLQYVFLRFAQHNLTFPHITTTGLQQIIIDIAERAIFFF